MRLEGAQRALHRKPVRPIQMLRDREILLLFEAEVGSGGQQLHNIAEIKGSAILREGEEKILLKTDENSLHATFSFEVEN